jgi:hypothetical protein
VARPRRILTAFRCKAGSTLSACIVSCQGQPIAGVDAGKPGSGFSRQASIHRIRGGVRSVTKRKENLKGIAEAQEVFSLQCA